MIKDFEYLAPKNLSEALSLVEKHGHDAKIIAGGQSLLVVLKQGILETEYLIDIKGLSELDYVKYDDKKGLQIGALTVHRTLEKSPVIKKQYPVISEMEDNLAVIQTRNWGTIGGNLSHADPAGDPAPLFIVLNAKLKLVSAKGERLVDMESFSKDYLETDLKPGELLAEIIVPPIPPNTGISYQKLMVAKGDMGIVGAAASVTVDPKNKTCKDVRIALSNAGSTPIRVKEAENILKGKVIDDKLLDNAAEIAVKTIDPPADVHGSAEYRKEMVKVFLKRAVKSALQRAS